MHYVKIEKIVKNSVDKFKTQEERIANIEKELQEKYPKFINKKAPIHFISAGGTFGAVKILYASLTEYLIIYGTMFGNSGPSGRFPFKVRDFVVSGKIATNLPSNPFKVNEFNPGQVTILPPLKDNFYKMENNTWVVEYSIGLIPASIFSIFANLVTTFDFLGTISLAIDFTKNIFKNILKFRF